MARKNIVWQHKPLTDLSVEGDGIGLTLGTYTAGPRWVFLTPRLDLARKVLQVQKLPPERQIEQTHVYINLTIATAFPNILNA